MWANLLGASKYVLIFVLSLSVASCGKSNAVELFANKEDDASLLQQATTYVNRGFYDSAINVCLSMPGSLLAGDGHFICTSAYAGKCGYSLLDLVAMIQAYDPGGPTKLLSFLLNTYRTGTVAQLDACETASEMIRAKGEASARPDNYNFMMVLMSLTHLGVAMAALIDSDDDGDASDETFNQCTDLDDTRTEEIGRTFWEIYQSAQALNNPLMASVSTALETLDTLLAGVNGGAHNFLDAGVDPTAYTADHRAGIRALVSEDSQVGVDLNNCTDAASCLVYVSNGCP